MLDLIILAIAALLTSMISAIIGMAGGVLLLAVMLGFLSHADTIPTHGAVQLVSNGTRILAFLQHVRWRALGRFAAGAVAGAALGGFLLYRLRHGHIAATEPYLKMLIGAYVLIMTFLPQKKAKDNPGHSPAEHTASVHSGPFAAFGFLAGALGLTIGAIGPLIAPLFLRSGFVKEELIATKAVCQACIHLLKIPVFLSLGAEFVQYDKLWLYILVMAVMVVPGTLLGKRILAFVSPQRFVQLFKAAMLLAGTKVLIYDGIYQCLAAA